MSDHNPWTTHSTEVAYENPWIRVEHSEVTTPGGSPGVYGVVRFENIAVGVIPIDDEDHTWLVGQYRYTLDEYSWEMPEGGCPKGESPEDAARRELMEETGLRAASLTPLISGIRLSNSVTDETAVAFLATDLTQGQAQPEDTEDLQVRRVPVEDAIEMVISGEINDSFTVMAFQRLALMRGERRP